MKKHVVLDMDNNHMIMKGNSVGILDFKILHFNPFYKNRDKYNKLENPNEIINKGDDGSITYKRAINIKNWLDNNKFNPNDYFTSSTSKKQNAAWAKLSEDERRRIFAEEWLTESLSQAELIKFLNEVEYKGEEINVAGISNEKKSIWQKIIEILLKFLPFLFFLLQ